MNSIDSVGSPGITLREQFETNALAESFRSDLVAAARKGEAFFTDTGLPVSMQRNENSLSWYDFVCGYVDMKWRPAAATYRRTIAEALTAVTPVMLKPGREKPHDKAIRTALCGWGFNMQRRDDPNRPHNVTETLRWIERNSQSVSYASNPDVARALLGAAITRLDGKPAARTVARQRRMILVNALSYAVERRLLVTNPVQNLKWSAPRPTREIERRRVVNPIQARSLLFAVRSVLRSGPSLAACFAAMYFAALRPEEAVDLRKRNLRLPAPTWNAERSEWVYDWGELYLEEATPHAGSAWTDSGRARDRRQLKHCEKGEGRRVPCPPELTAILREHLNRYGTDDEGRLFRGQRGGEVPLITWTRVWSAARRATFTPEILSTSLARVPYDLRHAAVSTWLNGGVPATVVAEWAGHSVQVLLEVYAKCLDGQDEIAKQQVQAALGHR
ncbi:MAG: tyrosine-type recombinase/integrase [Carbonactinosporaceae bacterium]